MIDPIQEKTTPLPVSNYSLWINKLQSELKGKALSDHDYIWEDIRISPFEEKKEIRTLKIYTSEPVWKIGAFADNANKSILHLLEYGAESISLMVDESKIDWKKILRDVHTDWIMWSVQAKHLEHLQAFLQFINSKKTVHQLILRLPDNYQAACFIQCHTLQHSVRCLGFTLASTDTSAMIANAWSQLISTINTLGTTYPIESILRSVSVHIKIGTEIAWNVSFIRAMRWIWIHLLKSFDLATSIPLLISSEIENNLSKSSDAMIHASLAAFNAISGSTDVLYIHPPDKTDKNKSWPLKAQYIMREESQLSKTHDPLGGSYVIEKLTETIAKNIWEKIT